jgi:hypothetical protein
MAKMTYAHPLLLPLKLSASVPARQRLDNGGFASSACTNLA